MNTFPRVKDHIQTTTILSGRHGLLRENYNGGELQYVDVAFAELMEKEIDRLSDIVRALTNE